jgi:superfamily II DNA/RNA helicase
MLRETEELVTSLQAALASQENMLAQGQAQASIRRDGALPADSPRFEPFLDNDLLNYSYALISTSIDLLDAPSTEIEEPTRTEQLGLARRGFIQASYALEAATRNAAPSADLSFHRLMAGAASHLGDFAARAYSLVDASIQSGRMTPMEATLADLILRKPRQIEERTRLLKTSPSFSDDALLQALRGNPADIVTLTADPTQPAGAEIENAVSEVGPIVALLSEHYMSAVSSALFAIAYGQEPLLQAAIADLASGEQAASDINAPGPWWIYRLTRRLIGDLRETSIRKNIPISRPPAATADTEADQRDWKQLRKTFVASLFVRKRSEIDLWPSQLHVIEQIFSGTNDLVISLPTSAGKTRIAELSILACLAQGRRAVYITPLRALSAQTERILERTFTPLGVRVSSLYGSMGTSDIDEDALRTSDIVVATPEKLDFALRSDPSVLDDVGVVILDEGHMIGPTEREIRYEAQVQRLLRRDDADTRRIVCLSAVFPSGEDLDDFVAWMTDDDPTGLHREKWRPTQQKFGLVQWNQNHARLTMTIGSGHTTFIPRYVEAKAPTGKRRNAFPSNNRELVIATAWRLVEEGQSVLVFCPQRNGVGPYADHILKLHQQGFIDTILPAGVDLADARSVGAEWFGADHPILKCLELGVAIHHAALPGPFRQEVERLLHDGVIKVTIASPTLAQGLNLSASVVLFHGLHREGKLLSGSDFSNVIGRAGRAFVDTEGLVLYPMFVRKASHLRQWRQLTTGQASKTLRSGMISAGAALINRVLHAFGSAQVQPFIDYVTGGSNWTLPVRQDETAAQEQEARQSWNDNLALLDTSILSIIGEDESDPDQVTQLLIDMLRDSLWERQLLRLTPEMAGAQRAAVTNRTLFIWNNSTPRQRRGWYLAGLGAATGFDLGLIAADVVDKIFLSEDAIAQSDSASAITLITDIASLLFAVDKFKPKTSLEWEPVLAHWLSGRPLGELADDRDSVVQFVEADLSYRLVWGMEAARVYETAQANPIAEMLTGTATAAIETGTLNQQAAILIRSGFDHRSAAIKAVEAIESTFDSSTTMRQWIRDLPSALVSSPDWPTTETHSAWLQFAKTRSDSNNIPWEFHVEHVEDVQWDEERPHPKAWLRVTDLGPGVVELWSTGFTYLGEARVEINPDRMGVLYARRNANDSSIELYYRGPHDLLLSMLDQKQ